MSFGISGDASFPNVEPRKLTEGTICRVRSAEFYSRTGGAGDCWQTAGNERLILALDISFLDRLLDNVVFLHVHPPSLL